MINARGLDRTELLRCWAGYASLGAGLVHIAVVRQHLAESPLLGVAFAVVGLAQVAWAMWALGSFTVPAPRATTLLTLGFIAAWVVSRTVGLSLNPLTAVPEPVGVADALTVVLEVAVIGCVLAARSHVVLAARAHVADAAAAAEQRPAQSATSARLALLAAGALAVSAIATPAMAATAAGQYAQDHHGARPSTTTTANSY